MINLDRFIAAQSEDYQMALAEIVKGRKSSNWMWYVFPQFKKLSKSSTTVFYAIKSREEAIAFLHHEVLGKRLLEISKALLEHKNKKVVAIFGKPDDMKIKSSMTLFSLVSDGESIFQDVLDQFFDGQMDESVKELLNSEVL
ncbi:MAG: DUF1810 domain-containing protein [Paludibacter sp.]